MYDTPGEYKVSLTVVKDDGTKDTTTHVVIVKNLPKQVSIEPSVSSGKTGTSVEFSIKATGQIESYAWDFGDGTANSSEANPVHVFQKAGKYQVILSARYTDGTVKTAEMTFSVED